MRVMMVKFGLRGGLALEKVVVFALALMAAIIAANGIDKNANWVYDLAITTWARNWMKRKKRYWVAFLPLYFVAMSQGIAAVSWIWIISQNWREVWGR